jgi:hypothetical protein
MPPSKGSVYQFLPSLEPVHDVMQQPYRDDEYILHSRKVMYSRHKYHLVTPIRCHSSATIVIQEAVPTASPNSVHCLENEKDFKEEE